MPPVATPSSSSSSITTLEKKKRKRVSRACDQCFQKKDRCDGLQPICTFCFQLERTCTYDRPERKRGPTQGLRPRLEQRIVALETVLGFLLCKDGIGINVERDDIERLKKADEKQRENWRHDGWLNSKSKLDLDNVLGLETQDLVTSVGFSSLTNVDSKPTTTTAAAAAASITLEEQDMDSDYSEVDLSLPPSHNPLNQTIHSHSSPSPESCSFNLPLLSSGKGGSSLNRGLVPRGADPNAVLGGFEIEFGGSEQDVDWVRRFIPPSKTSSSQSTGDAAKTRMSQQHDSDHSST
ncbi:uncharacterized protein UTRI_05519 [Ustilago trichophora]|uniref:Zn(2)-C6 fungal-type domain-containing protein n=1 Tax=Ustilago trichophora TaxID=86804 RepID=A0A5C3EJ19_9BASI|nr:uncharacterized protein UTRI_05519 [Ustilago trichophora]